MVVQTIIFRAREENSGGLLELHAQFFESPKQQSAILAQVRFRLLGRILRRGLRYQHDAAVGPCARRQSCQLRWNLLHRQNVNLAIGKIDEADTILANYEVRDVYKRQPSDHLS